MTSYVLRHNGDVVVEAADLETMLRAVEHLAEYEDEDGGLELGPVGALVAAIKADEPVTPVNLQFKCPKCGAPLTGAAGNKLSEHVEQMLDRYPHFELTREPEWFDDPLHVVLYCEREACGVGAPVTLENDGFEVVR